MFIFYRLTGSDAEWTLLFVHGEVLQVHEAGCADGETLGVQHSPVREQSAQTVQTRGSLQNINHSLNLFLTILDP